MHTHCAITSECWTLCGASLSDESGWCIIMWSRRVNLCIAEVQGNFLNKSYTLVDAKKKNEHEIFSFSPGLSPVWRPAMKTLSLERSPEQVFHSAVRSSAVALLLPHPVTQPASLSLCRKLICCNLASLSSVDSAATRSLICCSLASLSSVDSAATWSLVPCSLSLLQPDSL